MRVNDSWRSWMRAGVIGCALAAGTTALAPAAAAGAQAPAARQSGATGHVSPHPAKGTPQLAPNGRTEQVRQLVKCGGTMYAAGAFTAIRWGGKTYSRHNVFSFSATAPYRVTPW